MTDADRLHEQLAEARKSIGLLQKELQQTNSELLQLTMELDDRVAERTAELQKANDRLEAEIAEHRRTEGELARSNGDLQQFAYAASHDLQEPLRSITSYLQLLVRRSGEKLDDDARRFIGRTVAAAERMKALIDSLLIYSRVQTKGTPFAPTDCGELLEHTLDNLDKAIEESGAVVTRDDLPTVPVDAAQLGQLLQNLIGNAIKFRGDRAPRIHVGIERRNDEWVFSVRDHGIGIEEQNLERIFEVFQRLHTREEYEGTGIGLAVCRKIVERHGGRIWAEPAPGEGSIFSFTIPDRGDEGA